MKQPGENNDFPPVYCTQFASVFESGILGYLCLNFGILEMDFMAKQVSYSVSLDAVLSNGLSGKCVPCSAKLLPDSNF